MDALQIKAEVEARAIAGRALHLDGALHGVHDVLGDGEPEARALYALHSAAVLALEGHKELLLELLGHAHAGVAHHEVRVRPVGALAGGFLPEFELDGPARRRVLHGVAEEIQEHLAEVHAVADDLLRKHAEDEDVEVLPVARDLRAHDVAQGLQGLAQG